MGFLSEAGLIIEDGFREGNIPAGAGEVIHYAGFREQGG
jgi:hypothetical protein